jgi:hypothetical protein
LNIVFALSFSFPVKNRQFYTQGKAKKSMPLAFGQRGITRLFLVGFWRTLTGHDVVVPFFVATPLLL